MNFQLFNDKVWTFPLKCENSVSGDQPFPGGLIPAVVSSNPDSLSAQVLQLTFGGPYSLVLTPKVQASPDLTVTVSFAGIEPAHFVADIVADPDAVVLSVVVDTAHASTSPQNVPIAPGP